jgi:transcriptional regulator GlxA family with amidase domain
MAMLIYVLVLDDVFDLGLSAILDTLRTANELAAMDPDNAGAAFQIKLVGVRARVRTSHGLNVPVEAAAGLCRPDVVILPAIGAKMPAAVAAALERRDLADARDLLVKWASRGTRTCAACGGTFVLASAGLLDGGAATTTWWLAPLFRERFPAVALDESQMVVVSGGCVTAGAALAHLDLALWLVRQRSPALASLVARYLMSDPRPSAAVYAIPDHLRHTDPMVERFEAWARDALSTPFSLQAAARSVGTSPRTLTRRMQKVLGKTPLSYVQELRVQRAVHLLRTSDASVEEIAGHVGYRDGVTLRTLLRKKTGCGIRQLRHDWADLPAGEDRSG